MASRCRCCGDYGDDPEEGLYIHDEDDADVEKFDAWREENGFKGSDVGATVLYRRGYGPGDLPFEPGEGDPF